LEVPGFFGGGFKGRGVKPGLLKLADGGLIFLPKFGPKFLPGSKTHFYSKGFPKRGLG